MLTVNETWEHMYIHAGIDHVVMVAIGKLPAQPTATLGDYLNNLALINTTLEQPVWKIQSYKRCSKMAVLGSISFKYWCWFHIRW